MSWLTGFEHFVRQAEPLAQYTWFKLGGQAEYFAQPPTLEDLQALVRRCREENVSLRVIGGGSNILVRDQGVAGMVIRLNSPALAGVSVQGQMVTAGGGARLSHVISQAVGAGLAGLEPLVGIPGTIGGALYGNTGSHSTDIGQWTHSATVMTRSGEVLVHQAEDLQFAYRQSSFDCVAIVSAQFQLEREDPDELARRMQKFWIVGKSGQPAIELCTGRIFKDPRGLLASSLIEQAGLKGARIGKAEVDDQHANFIVASSGATAGDVLQLIDLMRSQVAERLGMDLENEIEIW